jgi:hypothetical protein
MSLIAICQKTLARTSTSGFGRTSQRYVIAARTETRCGAAQNPLYTLMTDADSVQR